MQIRCLALFAALLMPAFDCLAEDDIVWRHGVTRGALTVNANPLPPTQRTAFYIARGFSAESIRPYAEACGFSFRLVNRGAGNIRTRLADWQAIAADGRRARLRLPAEWEAEWARSGVPPSARVAFRWAQFQAENDFASGDWIMGMATLERPLPDGFRLVLRYFEDKEQREIILDQLSCAGD